MAIMQNQFAPDVLIDRPAVAGEARVGDQTRVPTLFIGLGGSGKEALMRLRKRFRDRYLVAQPDFARFLFFDSDVQPERFIPQGEMNKEVYEQVMPEPREIVNCQPDPAYFKEALDRITRGVQSSHLDWVKPAMLKIDLTSIGHGVGTHRQLGRMVFFQEFADIRAQIERALNELTTYAANLMTSQIEVVIVTSLAGGTGAGMFIDVAALTRYLLKPKTLNIKGITLVAVMPSVYRDLGEYDRFQQNAFAALMEMEYFGTTRTGDDLFLGELDRAAAAVDYPPFRATWDGQNELVLREQLWNNCYLIDSANETMPGLSLPRPELFQMIADYLFLDFEENQFAAHKRSVRSNLVQNKHGWKIVRVKKPAPPRNASQAKPDSDVVYATQNGLAYNSFGLAEIAFDLKKLYQAAGYLLAKLLLDHAWLGDAKRYQSADYTKWTQDDLYDVKAAAGQAKAPPSFKRTDLIDQILSSPNVNRIADLNDKLEKLDKDQANRDEMEKELKTHQKLLAASGAVTTMIRDNLLAFRGDANELGKYRSRLRQLTILRLDELGVEVTRQLLRTYQKALSGTRENLKAEPAPGRFSFDRLLEAENVWPPSKGLALKVEAAHARADLREYLDRSYNRAAARSLDELLADSELYLGVDKTQVPDELATRHKTLWDFTGRVDTFLKHVKSALETRYSLSKQLRPASAGDSTNAASPPQRRRLLESDWNDQTYMQKINQTVLAHPQIGAAGAKGGGPTPLSFNWTLFEKAVLKQLHEITRQGETTRTGWISRWLDHEAKLGDRGVDQVAERLAEACRRVLESGEGLNLTDVANGNAIDILVNQPHNKPPKLIVEEMVRSSAPYLPVDRQIYALSPPPHPNLYGHRVGNAGASSEQNAQKVHEWVCNEALTTDGRAAGQVGAAIPADNSAIFMAREVAGIPLQAYSHLAELKRSYLVPGKITQHHDECHIDWRLAHGELPDIDRIDNDVYARIRGHIDTVLLSMMIGTIVWTGEAFTVRVRRPFGPGFEEFLLGRRIHWMIRDACETKVVTNKLSEAWKEWENKPASPRHWACLFASALKTWIETGSRFTEIRQTKSPAPIYNCFGYLLDTIEDRMKATPEGQRLYDRLEEESRVDSNAGTGGRPLLASIEEHCLRRDHPDVPIYRVIFDRLGDVDWPGADPS